MKKQEALTHFQQIFASRGLSCLEARWARPIANKHLLPHLKFRLLNTATIKVKPSISDYYHYQYGMVRVPISETGPAWNSSANLIVPDTVPVKFVLPHLVSDTSRKEILSDGSEDTLHLFSYIGIPHIFHFVANYFQVGRYSQIYRFYSRVVDACPNPDGTLPAHWIRIPRIGGPQVDAGIAWSYHAVNVHSFPIVHRT